ncbi:hypothetical protein [endosymbiont of Lamellibrachia barhami]|nr:hypothetical protein [endosymbiont of Lamellibrachia barhami]
MRDPGVEYVADNGDPQTGELSLVAADGEQRIALVDVWRPLVA